MTTYDCSDPAERRSGLDAAAAAARAGNLVVMPTDTVYGIGADAFNAAAVRALLAAKGRGPDMPVPVLVGSWATIDGLVLQVTPTARTLIEALCAKHKGTGVEGLVQEYSLSSQEGVALMCLAEALLRIPDTDTRDALIRDKIARGEWRTHLGKSPSLFVNAATWVAVSAPICALVSASTCSVSNAEIASVLRPEIAFVLVAAISSALNLAMPSASIAAIWVALSALT